MHGLEHGSRDRGVRRGTARTAAHPEASGADLALAQETHALVSLFLEIGDEGARRRCLDYVRRQAGSDGAGPQA